MSEQDKAREIANKLRAENEAKEKAEIENRQKAESQLAVISKNSELAKMYAENASAGSANLAGELPLLKVHQTGKSTKNELTDGSEPSDGWFFYKPTGEQFEALECHILTISRGFRAEGLNNDKVFNQIVGGVIIDGDDYKPFIMYVTGKKLQPMWDFGKAASKYTHAKPIPIPMFALTVKLSTHKEENSYGKSWLIDFEIKKSEDGTPVLITDPGIFHFLKDNVTTLEETIEGVIAAKTNKDTEVISGEDPGPVNPAGDLPFD